MIRKNRNFRKMFVAGIVLLIVIFCVPFIWPVDARWYFQNLNWMVPLVIVMFIVPMVPFLLSGWDMHFTFTLDPYNSKLRATITNVGMTPFSFNRVQFASGKKHRFFGKRELYPQEAMSDKDIEFHGADTPSQLLNQHMGYALSRGMPIILEVRNPKVASYFGSLKNKEVYLSLYYDGVDQKVCSQRIPIELNKRITEKSSST